MPTINPTEIPSPNFIHGYIDNGDGTYSPRYLKVNSSGQLETSATISGDVNIDNTSNDTSGFIGKASGTNGDFVTAYASGTTITLSTLPGGVSSITADDIVSVVQIATTGAVTATYTRDDSIFTAAGTDPTTLTVSSATFAASDTFVVYTNIARPFDGSSFDSSSDSDKSFEVAPLSSQHVEETLADVTNGADDTYYYYVDMDGYRKGNFQLTINGGSGTVTSTIEGSMQDDGTVPASVAYIDVTNAAYGSANFTASAVLADNAEYLSSFKYVRVKIIAATGDADDADWTIYHKRLY